MRAAILCSVLAACSFHQNVASDDGQPPPGDGGRDAVPSDGADGADATDAPPGNPNGYDKTITVQRGKVAGDVTGFPVWVELAADVDLQAHARVDHGDVYFTDTSGNPIAYEITSWDRATGLLRAWVRVPHLTPSTQNPDPNQVHLRFGGPNAPLVSDGTQVFNNNFAAVWHLDGLAGTAVADATTGTPGTLSGGATVAPGKLGSGLTFSGTTSSISFTNPIIGGGASTMSAWVDLSAPGSGTFSYAIIVIGTALGDQARWFYARHGGHNGSISAGLYTDDHVPNPVVVVPATTWKKLDWVCDGPNRGSHIYIDGTEIDGGGAFNVTPNTTGTAGLIANAPVAYQSLGNTGFNGVLDEVRIAKTVRSANWIKTEFNNQSDPTSFYVLGTATPR